jgi:hypothetical protein
MDMKNIFMFILYLLCVLFIELHVDYNRFLKYLYLILNVIKKFKINVLNLPVTVENIFIQNEYFINIKIPFGTNVYNINNVHTSNNIIFDDFMTLVQPIN